jgi:hypothetical protein
MELHTHNGLDSPKIDVDGAFIGATALRTKDDQTVAGVKTFSSIPVLPASDPTTDNQLVRKSYIDDLADTAPTGSIAASDRVIDSADDLVDFNGLTPNKEKEIQYHEENATIRVKFDLNVLTGDGTANGQIYINGVAAGTARTSDTNDPDWDSFTEDLAVETDDLVQLYIYRSGSTDYAQARNFRLCYHKPLDITPGTVNQD